MCSHYLLQPQLHMDQEREREREREWERIVFHSVEIHSPQRSAHFSALGYDDATLGRCTDIPGIEPSKHEAYRVISEMRLTHCIPPNLTLRASKISFK